MADLLFDYKAGWEQTIEYRSDDVRLPQVVRDFNCEQGLFSTVAAPLLLGGKNLGWITLCAAETAEGNGSWWRTALVEAIARHAALALHKSRPLRTEACRGAPQSHLEERNRIARDIHDNLAQGLRAILMQLQAGAAWGRAAAAIRRPQHRHGDRACALAHGGSAPIGGSAAAERQRQRGPHQAIKRVADLARKTSDIPIDVHIDDLPRFGDGVEREVIGIAQEALTNAVRHARAQRITIRASTVNSLGLRLSIADDGRGIPRERASSGFGMTSMQERAERIGASLTIVTAPRSGTEVVLAWEPTALPTQIHAFN
jgi:signal transduction histidine kinase